MSAERILREILLEYGIQHRTTEKVGGQYPALTIPHYSVVVFVSDCYDDRCPWDHPDRKSPKVWKKTQDFDAALRKEGWVVLRVWQHELEKTPKLVAGKVAQVVRAIQKALGEA